MTCLVQVAKVYIATDLAILVLHKYYVREPFGMLNGLNKTNY